jgi:antitoxin ChpS
MELILRKFGNRTVVVWPPHILREFRLRAGSKLSLEVTADGKIVLERKQKYTLAELIAQCDPNAPPPADMALWDEAKPVGNETL